MSSRDSCEFTVDIDQNLVDRFAEISGDYNPLHTDDDYAKSTSYGGTISHGMLLMALASRVLGMYIPGHDCIILSSEARFPNAVRVPAQLTVTGRLVQSLRQDGAGVVEVVASSQEGSLEHLHSRFTFMTGHGVNLAPPEPGSQPKHPVASGAGRPTRRLLITGGTGAIGSHLIGQLSGAFRFLCLTREDRTSDPDSYVEYARVDLQETGAFERFLSTRDPNDFYGALHVSSPPPVNALLSDNVALMNQQYRHSAEIPVLLANWSRQRGSAIRRLILLSSVIGNSYPIARQGAYSFGKNLLSGLPRLLAVDLAEIAATVNAIEVGWTDVGMNASLTRLERARRHRNVAIGRAISLTEISALVTFLLSDEASAITGTSIPVDGGLALS